MGIRHIYVTVEVHIGGKAAGSRPTIRDDSHMTAERKHGRTRFRITYRRRGWGLVEFVRVYEAETHHPEAALGGFLEENALSRDEIVRLEELEEHRENSQAAPANATETAEAERQRARAVSGSGAYRD